MAEIYNDLDSPVVPDTCVPLARRIANGQQVWGLRSQLYGYQRRSIAVMIDRELNHLPVQDPSFVTVCGMRGEKYFFQPSTMIILRERPMVFNCRGGLLCEELGLNMNDSMLSGLLKSSRYWEDHHDPWLDSRHDRPTP